MKSESPQPKATPAGARRPQNNVAPSIQSAPGQAAAPSKPKASAAPTARVAPLVASASPAAASSTANAATATAVAPVAQTTAVSPAKAATAKKAAHASRVPVASTARVVPPVVAIPPKIAPQTSASTGNRATSASRCDDFRSAFFASFPRGVAAFLGIFSLLNLMAEIISGTFDANIWWIDFWPFPDPVKRIILLTTSCLLLAYAVQPRFDSWRRRATTIALETLMVFAVWDIVMYYDLLIRGKLFSGLWAPFSLVVLVALAYLWRSVARQRPSNNHAATWTGIAVSLILCAVIFPLAQMVFFGMTDYRRHCDATIVLGARVNPDGKPSGALADRVALAVQLYKDKLTHKLIFSGAKGQDEPLNEADAMKAQAIAAGVPAEDILLDRNGVDTATTVENCIPLLEQIGTEKNARAFQTSPVSAIVVSHFYRLPRIKMTFQQRAIFTVPVREPLARTPQYMAREVLALWKYYFSLLIYHP